MKKFLCILASLPSLTVADPGPATQYLIDEPASLMDIGMLRAELLLNEFAESHSAGVAKTSGQKPSISAQAAYDMGNDIIVLSFWIMSKNPRSLCESILNSPILGGPQVMPILGTEGQTVDWGLDGYIATLFTHSGYTKAAQPKDLADKVSARIEIRCSGDNISARRRYLEENIYWSEEGS